MRLSLALLLLICVLGCQFEAEQNAVSMTGGNPSRGKHLIQNYGCYTCHTIPGIPNATATVGPPLDKFSRRTYIGGVMNNTPENLMRWIRNPSSIDDKTAMPNLKVRDDDSRDIAAYLYTLR
jgi:cytochrome c